MKYILAVFTVIIFIILSGCDSPKKDQVNQTDGAEQKTENIEQTETVTKKANKPEMDKKEKSSVAEDLKKVLFFGNEPNWTLTFYDNYAEYTRMGQESAKIYYKKSYSDNSEPKLTEVAKADEHNTIKFQGSLDGWGTLFTIRKENCSDGMSENTYPYSIRLLFDESEELAGCGRIK